MTTGIVVVAGEISTETYVDIARVARETVIGIGYDRAGAGFDGNTCGVMVAIDEQSPDIAGGVDTSWSGGRRHRRRSPTTSTRSGRATRE